MSFFKSRFFSLLVGFALGLMVGGLWSISGPVRMAWHLLHGNSPFNTSTTMNFQFPMAPGVPGTVTEPEDDAFAQMEKMRKQALDNMFHSQMDGDEGQVSDGLDIEQHEDTNSVELVVKIEGLAEENLNVEVKDHMISVRGMIHQKQGSFEIQQSFQRQFPVPEGVDEKRVEIAPEKDRLLLKFPKVTK